MHYGAAEACLQRLHVGGEGRRKGGRRTCADRRVHVQQRAVQAAAASASQRRRQVPPVRRPHLRGVWQAVAGVAGVAAGLRARVLLGGRPGGSADRSASALSALHACFAYF